MSPSRSHTDTRRIHELEEAVFDMECECQAEHVATLAALLADLQRLEAGMRHLASEPQRYGSEVSRYACEVLAAVREKP